MTRLTAGNAYGERLPIFVVGKANKPRCFKGVRNLPCCYHTQRKSWMTAELCEEWVRQLGRKFSAANRKIALIINNCTAHLHVEKLNSIELIFLPPITTSHTQPMDQGIIRSLKTKYRIRKEKSCTNHIDFIRYDDARKDLEMLFRTKLSQIVSRKLVSLRKKWKKCLMTKMTPSNLGSQSYCIEGEVW